MSYIDGELTRRDPDGVAYYVNLDRSNMQVITAPPPPVSSPHILPLDSDTRRRIVDPHVPGESFKKVMSTGMIKMTNLEQVDIKDKYYISVLDMKRTQIRWPQRWGCVGGSPVLETDPVSYMSTYYKRRTDISRLQQMAGVQVYGETPDSLEERVGDAINSCLSNVVNDSHSGFDLLTNMAEFPETFELLKSILMNARHPLRGIKALIERERRSRDRGGFHPGVQHHDDIASAWMQYRYAIMPLVLSIKDAAKLLDQVSDKYKTDHSRQIIMPTISSSVVTNDSITWEHSGTISVSATAKAAYLSPASRLSSLININIFLTAWELIPMSFVIDWFINVGDIILAYTTSVADFASERKYCVSVRRQLTSTAYHNYEYNYGDRRVSPSYDAGLSCGPLAIDVGYDFSDIEVKTGRNIIFRRIDNSYKRAVKQPTDVRFTFNPTLSWRRWLDGYVLSLNFVRKALKTL